ncbi:MAG: hypothetical protein P8X73_11490 [Ignavibacteriaceae bacterium]
MKSKIASSSFLLFLSFLILACNEKSTEPSDEITAKPVVRKSSINYNQISFNSSFPDTISLNSISKAYSNNYSEELRIKILDYMRDEVIKLGEDINIFDSVLCITGCKRSVSGVYILPTYAERAQYENQDVWIFQVTYGLAVPNFGRFKCFAISVANLDTLALEQSR